ncbi:uncharacterized protein LOC128215889 [Mya arenaria]|uniref:uncharacterized protein LOC128215889 n=1 Tax=Mya arenaria TaxID=6604 RepID=UPI0022E7D7BB|nr:uncharacterized protein LOC128215889 [Mya arenaria]
MDLDMIVILFCTFVSINNYVAGVLLCNGSTPCPAHKPYCTNAGCVFQCPLDSYVNGDHCVRDCGTMFVDQNKRCTDQCETNFFRESVRGAGEDFIIDKKCVTQCVSQEYVLRNECVTVCPIGQRYVDTDEDHFFYFILSTVEMVGSCYYPIQINVEGVECVDKCDEDNFEFNGTCVSSCPFQFRFVTNGICHSEKCNSLSYVFDQYVLCTEKCNINDFYLNSTCVYTCPPDYVVENVSCIETCSFDRVLVNVSMTVNGCSSSCSVNVYRQYFRCQEKCPSGLFLMNRTCVFACPSNSLALKGECVESCPITSPYKQSFLSEIERWQRSKAAHFTSYNTIMTSIQCVTNCSEPYAYDKITQMCVSTCPLQRPYLSRLQNIQGMRTCVPNCIEKYLYRGIYCVDVCPKVRPIHIMEHV